MVVVVVVYMLCSVLRLGYMLTGGKFTVFWLNVSDLNSILRRRCAVRMRTSGACGVSTPRLPSCLSPRLPPLALRTNTECRVLVVLDRGDASHRVDWLSLLLPRFKLYLDWFALVWSGLLDGVLPFSPCFHGAANSLSITDGRYALARCTAIQ